MHDAYMEDLTLESLPEAFALARAESSRTAKHAAGEAPYRTCRYCGEFMSDSLLSPNSVLDGHARCCVPLSFQRAVRRLWWTTIGLSGERIGRACGVSVTAVNKWIRNADRHDALERSGSKRGISRRI